MTRIRGSLDIACPVEEVFDTVADQRNEPRYNARMIASTKLTDGPIGVGTRFEATVLSRGKPLPVTIEYTDFERPHLIASRSVMAGAVAAGHIHCDPIAGGPGSPGTGRSPSPVPPGSQGRWSAWSVDARSGRSGPASNASSRAGLEGGTESAGVARPHRDGSSSCSGGSIGLGFA